MFIVGSTSVVATVVKYRSGLVNIRIVLLFGALLTITALAIAGSFAGNYLGQRIDGQKLKKAFGWFVLATAAFIIIKEMT